MKIDFNTTVGQLAAETPAAVAVFRALKVDFCCGGKRPLKDALAEAHVAPAAFEAMLDAAVAQRTRAAEGADYAHMRPAALTAYIEDTHHAYLRETLPEASALLLKTLNAHGRNHAELFDVYGLFGRLKADLEQHLVKEEALLFPALAQDGPTDEATRALASQVMREHDAAGELLRALSALTGGYEAPADACPTYRKAYALLGALENDLHQHIHLENNILLKEMA